MLLDRRAKHHHVAMLCSVLIITHVFMLSIAQESVVRVLSIVYVVACELSQLQHI